MHPLLQLTVIVCQFRECGKPPVNHQVVGSFLVSEAGPHDSPVLTADFQELGHVISEEIVEEIRVEDGVKSNPVLLRLNPQVQVI